jgi:hypothetical protein
MPTRQLRKGLDFFAKDDTWLVSKKYCLEDKGFSPREIRNCCEKREYKVCFDCPDFPWTMAKDSSGMIERGQECRRLG